MVRQKNNAQVDMGLVWCECAFGAAATVLEKKFFVWVWLGAAGRVLKLIWVWYGAAGTVLK